MLRMGRNMLETIREDPLVKVCQEEFARSFVGSDRELTQLGGAQLHLDAGETGEKFSPKVQALIHDMQCKCQPNDMVTLDDSDYAFLDAPEHRRLLMTPSIFGFGSRMRYIGAEFMSVGCFRIQVEGSRRVVVVAYNELRAMYFEATKLTKASTVVKYDDIMSWLRSPQSKVFLARMAAHRRLHFGIVSPGEVMWVPPGAVVAAATHECLAGWGLRLPFLVQVAWIDRHALLCK